jgi:hypothetical protein
MCRPLQRACASRCSGRLDLDIMGITTGEINVEFDFVSDHRQDSKGTWWMPWHLEAMKDVNDCDKPR